MSNEIFYTCRCIGKAFTWKEWCEQQSVDAEEIMAEFNGFRFNLFDVCLNPKVPVSWNNKFCRIQIEVSQSPNGKWDYGYSYWFHNTGGGSASAFVSDEKDGYSTEKECIHAALTFLEEKAQRRLKDTLERGDTSDYDDEDEEPQPKNSVIASQIRAALKKIQEYKQVYNPKELCLFDF